jgi:hypothetical protein
VRPSESLIKSLLRRAIAGSNVLFDCLADIRPLLECGSLALFLVKGGDRLWICAGHLSGQHQQLAILEMGKGALRPPDALQPYQPPL